MVCHLEDKNLLLELSNQLSALSGKHDSIEDIVDLQRCVSNAYAWQ